MKVENTELDYKEEDAIALDFYLGGERETKEEWAKRVWDNCKLYYEGTEISSVYKTKINQTWQERAQELWENKKSRRRESLGKQFKAGSTDQDMQQIKSDPTYKTEEERFLSENQL